MTRNRLRRVFEDLGFATPEGDDVPGLDDYVVAQLVGMAAENKGYRMLEPAETTDRLRRLVADFAKAVRRTLMGWGTRHEPWLKHGEDGEELYYDDGPYAVLMTLRGEGVGVWDGRWDHHFKPEHAEQAVKNLKAVLQRDLRRWADTTGGGVLNAAFDAEAERQGRAQNPELEDDEAEDEAEDEVEQDEQDGQDEPEGERFEGDDRGHYDESGADSGYARARAPRRGVPAPYIAPTRRRR